MHEVAKGLILVEPMQAHSFSALCKKAEEEKEQAVSQGCEPPTELCCPHLQDSGIS